MLCIWFNDWTVEKGPSTVEHQSKCQEKRNCYRTEAIIAGPHVSAIDIPFNLSFCCEIYFEQMLSVFFRVRFAACCWGDLSEELEPWDQQMTDCDFQQRCCVNAAFAVDECFPGR